MIMKKVMVELDWDTVDGIILSQLTETLLSLEGDLDRRINGEDIAVFDQDQAKDINFLSDHVESFKKVLSFFGG